MEVTRRPSPQHLDQTADFGVCVTMASSTPEPSCTYSVAIRVVGQVVHHLTQVQNLAVDINVGVAAVEAAMGCPMGSLKVRP